MKMNKRRACIVYDCFGVGDLFKSRGYEVSQYKEGTPASSFDLLVFTGGSDIDSMLYGEKAVHCGGFNKKREQLEMYAYGEGYARLKVGICRGGQFLNVRAGGKLWQDVDNHGGTHLALDVRTGKTYPVSSAHHQMMIPSRNSTHEIIATSVRTNVFKSEKLVVRRGEKGAPKEDLEAIWYPPLKSLCFQWHPEFGPQECEDYSFDLIDEKYNAVYSKKA